MTSVAAATLIIIANDIWLMTWAIATELRNGVRVSGTVLFGGMFAESLLIYAVAFLLSR